MLGCPTNRALENLKIIIKKRAYLFKIRYNGIDEKPKNGGTEYALLQLY